MKAALFFAGLLLASSAWASVEFRVAPESPAVFKADHTYEGETGPVTIPGPWFSVQYNITSDQLVTVVGIQEIVTAHDGSTIVAYVQLPVPMEIQPHRTAYTPIQYIGALRKQTDLIYNVSARLIGWEGGAGVAGPFLDSSIAYVTQ